MIVISDTSPLNYLILVGHANVLPVLFDRVVIPPAVLAELRRTETPAEVRKWIEVSPAWLAVQSPTHLDQAMHLGAGEIEAVSLAVELHASLLLADDRKARREAMARGLNVVGTLGVLELASERQLIDLPVTVSKLRTTSFHVSDAVLTHVLAADAVRRAQRGG